MSLKLLLAILLFVALPFGIETVIAQTGVRSQVQTQDSTNSSTVTSNTTTIPSNNVGTGIKQPLPNPEPNKPEPPTMPIKPVRESSTSSVTKPVTMTPITSTDTQKLPSESKVEVFLTDPELEQTYKDSLKDYYSTIRQKNQAAIKTYEFNNWVLENRKATFDWQHFTGKIIFGMVILLVLTGVAFSGIQFYIAMKQANRRRKVSKSEGQENEILPTTLKANLSGVEVSSSIFGVIILIVSFLFFYLYLVYVYPITVIAG